MSAAIGLVLLAVSCSGAKTPTSPTATPTTAPPTTAAPPPPASNSSWPTYHANMQRTGVDTTSPAMQDVHQAWTSTLDGAIYAEPLVEGDRVFVATENDSVYALSASTGKIAWRTNVGDPIPRSMLPCGNIDPTGITGTPAIDTDTGTLYAVAFVQPGQHEFVAIDSKTGRLLWRKPADTPGMDPLVHQQRGALAISNGRVYAPYGGLQGDCGDYHGQVVGMSLDGSGVPSGFQVPSEREAGIWASAGVAVDQFGNLLVTTGNGSSTLTYDYGDTVIKLSPNLKVLDRWAPSNWRDLNSGDVDLGSIGPTILPNGLLFQSGKEGVGYLLRADHLGGVGGAAFAKQACDGGAWGGTAALASRVFVPCGDGLVALKVGSDPPAFTVAWQVGGIFAGPPIVAGGAVWTVDIVSGRLLAFDLKTGKQLLSQEVGPVEHFTTPTAFDGRLYVAATDRVVAFTGV